MIYHYFLLLSLATGWMQPSETMTLELGLFESEEVLDLELRGNIRELFNKREDDTRYYPMKIAYRSEEGEEVEIELKVRARGNFRRQRGNCTHPPLLLNFAKSKTPATSLFVGQDKIKLVTPCRGEQYVIREYLAYKLYNLLTEYSFRARLVRVVYTDVPKGKQSDPLYGILLEDEDEMADRLGGKIVKANRLKPYKTDSTAFHRMAVFEYVIGNTDWSIQYRHNIKLLFLSPTAKPIPIPYDFDHAGIVNAPYAKPPEPLGLKSVRERRYRGYCLSDLNKLNPVFELFEARKDEIYDTFQNSTLLDRKYVQRTVTFLDRFYETVSDAKDRQKTFGYPCDPRGTGHIVIRGL